MRVVGADALARQFERLSTVAPRVVAAGNFATPMTLIGLVDEALPQYRLFVLNGQPGLPDRAGVVHETPFVGPGVRRSGRLEYIPARLSLVPSLFARTHVPDLVLLHTTTPRDGRVSLGIEVNVLPAAVEQARQHGGLVVAQMNPRMPWTFGDAELSLDLVDLAIEVDEPLQNPTLRAPSPLAQAIGERVAALVPHGGTLQLGIGAVPDAVLQSLRRHRGLRVWSEMFSDGVLALAGAGALAVSEPLVASFLFGSSELYAWVHRNPRVTMRRTEVTNDPGLIARQPAMTAVNSALEVDLFGQANASWVGGHIYSGFGGQSDFVVGALHAAGGTAVIALPSWHPKADRSTIVGVLDGPVTSFQHSWVVTEYGAAAIWPKTSTQQASNLIAVAHPRAREALMREAQRRTPVRGRSIEDLSPCQS